MKLVIFDIDGTIVDSVEADSRCYIQAFKELFDIDLGRVDWNTFTHVTDTGLAIEIFEFYLNRKPSKQELEALKAHFYHLLLKEKEKFREIKGARDFISQLKQNDSFELGFATGGWKETAVLKCESIGLDLNAYLLKSSNDHFARNKIIELLINEVRSIHQVSEFERIVYFGDGLWDLRTCEQLGIDFIGVDFEQNGKLLAVGCDCVIKDFSNLSQLIELL